MVFATLLGLQGGGRAEAVRLRAAAIEQLAQLDEDSARALYRAARAADPTYFPAQHEYIMQMLYWFRGPELRRELLVGDTSTALMACLLAASRFAPDDDRPIKQLLALEARFGPTQCTDAFLVPMPGGYSAARAARAIRDSPNLSEVLSGIAGRRNSDGDWRGADEMLLAGMRATDNPMMKFALMRMRADGHVARGDTAGTLAIWSAIAREVHLDGRAGPTAAFYSAQCDGQHVIPLPTRMTQDQACRRFFALVRSRRAKHTEWEIARRSGWRLRERGDLAAAAPLLTRSVQLADSLGVPGLQLNAYTERGRYFVKAGRISLAVRDLTKATAIGAAAELPYYLAEAYHNLAHAHEGAGRFSQAAEAADSFVAIASMLPGSSLRWVSHHDAGTIRWSAGWHAAAQRNFEAMVRIVDELGNDGHAFAGEYFERIGDLGRALQYYSVGARLPSPDPRNLAALARVYEAFGLPDSAEAFARLHDANSERWPITERPLLPDLLAGRGRVGDAIVLAAEWAHRQLKTGNVEGATIAHLRLAELQLLGRDPKAAVVAALRADSLIRLLRLNAYQVKATTLKGRALFADRRAAEGLTALREAARLARARPSTDATLSSNLALGDALAALRRQSEAIIAFDRAAIAVERMTSGLTEDAHRAGFKSQHLAPFDGALRALLDSNTSRGAAEAALRWSARRKAAALKLAGQPGGVGQHPPTISELRSKLQPDDALIDFSILDSTVVAIVLRRQSATYTSLQISPARLSEWIEALRGPLVGVPGGSVDLAHAPFSAAVAESLYRALLMPLEPQLRGVTRLAIAPDGTLWYMPFAALVMGRARDALGRARPAYLVERYEIRLLPSSAYLGDGRGSVPRGFRVAALAHDVPGDTNEVLAIRGALGAARVVSSQGTAATERRALTSSASVLHLAVHGVVDDRDPLRSHLRMAPEGTDDGLLHLSEVASRPLAARLVVLTACEAVSGKLYAGEGLVGVARAFLIGGARHVVASSWPVTSSAAELSSTFYRELNKGHAPSAALRAAQLTLLSSARTSHPLHWAAFVAFEAGGPRVQ